MTNSVKIFSICIIFFLSSLAYTKEHLGPEAPKILYRIDHRKPSEMFVSGGSGFQSWRQQEGLPGPGPNLMQHIQGSSIDQRTTDFVSTTGSLSGLEVGFNRFIVPDIQELWVYDISPNEDAYNVNWCWEDLPGLTSQQRRLWRRYEDQDEWVFNGGIRLNQIRGAQRRVWSPLRNRYEDDNSPDSYVSNPHYAASLYPARQRINPMRERTPERFTTVYGYEPHELPPTPVDLPSVDLLPSLGSSCIGAAFSYFSSNKTRRSPTTKTELISEDKSCSFDEVKELSLELPTIPSPIVFSSTDHRSSKCAVPYQAYSQRYGKWLTYLQLVDYRDSLCTANKAIYDQNHQINYYYHNTDMCLAISSELARGDIEGEQLILGVCDYKSPLQKFVINNGQIYALFFPYIQIYIIDDFAYAYRIPRKIEYQLDRSKMAKGFFDDPSLPTNYLTEIGLAWEYYDEIFYSTVTSWCRSYNQPTFYDTEKKAIFLMDQKSVGERQFLAPRCLQSVRSPGSFFDWYWTNWLACQTRINSSEGLQWDIEQFDNTNDVTIKDGWKNDLWVTLTGRNAGEYFTSIPGKSYRNSTKTHVLNVFWKQKCQSTDMPWFYCIPEAKIKYGKLTISQMIEAIF